MWIEFVKPWRGRDIGVPFEIPDGQANFLIDAGFAKRTRKRPVRREPKRPASVRVADSRVEMLNG